MAEMETDDIKMDPIQLIRYEVSCIQELQKRAMEEHAEKDQIIEIKINSICHALEDIEQGIKDEEENDESATTTSLRSDKLSDVAKLIIERAERPLNSENLKKFLMEEAFGKPKPEILPIARGYTNNIEELVKQLIWVREEIKMCRLLSNDQRRLDFNLTSRINKLLENIEKEMKSTQKQASIKEYLKPAKN